MSNGRSDSAHDADEKGLKEKYLHSMGAALYDEGRYDEAIDFFERAIELDDQPYSHYHLCLAYTNKRDFEKALLGINKAITLNPFVAKYYHRRSLIWQSLGNAAQAAEDYEQSLRLDRNYARVREIRSSYDTIEQAFSNPEMLEWCDTVRTKNGSLSAIVREIERSLKKTREAVEESSCALPCPAYCCHFEGETIRHGVHIGAWKLQAIRGFLKAEKLSEEGFLGRIRFTGEEHMARLIPPHHMVRERDESFVYYPKRGKVALSRALLENLPKGKDYQELLWINEKSRACAFLHQGRCMVHDLGGEPGLPACKEFLCMTGFVIRVLNHLGIIELSQLERHSMAELNRLAVEALLILGRTLYSEQLTRVRGEGYDTLKAAARVDNKATPDEIECYIDKYGRLSEEYRSLFESQKEEARQQIRERQGKD